MILAADDIARLVEHMRRTGVAEIEIEDGDEALRVVLPEVAERSVSMTVSEPTSEQTIVTASACGTFLPGHPARESSSIGGRVDAGEILGVLALGPLLQPVVAPCTGTLTRLLSPRGQRVDFGTPLFALAPHPQSPDFTSRKDVS